VEHDDESLVVTNAHVIPTDLDVDRREQLVVYSGRGSDARQHPATLVERDDEHDLALLRYAPPHLPAMRLGGDGFVREGEAVAFTGFPIGAVLGLFPATHTGIIAAITPMARVADDGGQLTAAAVRRLRAPFDVYQLDAIAYPGNSGSAVWHVATGEVVGVINSVFVKGSRENLLSQPSGITYAIPVRYVRQLLEALE
jgi:S1-C subfamily serine protease